MVKLADMNSKVVAITAAMPNGTALDRFQSRHPNRYFDVGIAEEHAVIFAADSRPKDSSPSSPSTRHSCSARSIPLFMTSASKTCRWCSAWTAQPRATTVRLHHGLSDISYLRGIPNLVHMVPKDEDELADMLFTAMQHNGPIAIRYPRGTAQEHRKDVPRAFPIGPGRAFTAWRTRSRRNLRVGGPSSNGAQLPPSSKARGSAQPSLMHASPSRSMQAWSNLWPQRGRDRHYGGSRPEGGFGSAVLERLNDLGLELR